MSREFNQVTLIEMLYSSGLIQLGNFAQPDGTRSPMLLRFDLLASYPAILDAVAEALAPLLRPAPSRLLCAWDAVALGTALALKTGIPLVYSRGIQDAPVQDLVGAYDIGHQTILLLPEANRYTAAGSIGLIARARSVGLDVVGIVSWVKHRVESDNEPPIAALLHLNRFAELMMQAGYFTRLQAEMITNS